MSQVISPITARNKICNTFNVVLIGRQLPKLLKLLDQLRASPLHGAAKTLTSWLEPIVGMWRFSKSNGITEGFHTKMEMMSRRAFGFRNFENYNSYF